MCYILLLSTTSARDLSAYNDDWIRFSTELPDIADARLLVYPHRWYVGSKSGCSCTFRHLHSVELGFDVPQDWYPEEPDGIEATGRLIMVIRALVEAGAGVDCIDVWEHQDPGPAVTAEREVDLARLDDRAFRLFENQRFEFVSRPADAGEAAR